jgi:hypothetical protein
MSTAMMRSFESRPDTAVVDEPFYGYYLYSRGEDRPGRTSIIKSMPTDWRDIVTRLCHEHPANGASICFQKHMARHLVKDIDRGFLARLRNMFLIRDPRLQVLSYAKKRPDLRVEDLGWTEMREIYELYKGPIVDANDILRSPAAILTELCARLGIEFDRSMLSWPAGRRATDGIWAGHWYSEVENSVGFSPFIDPASVAVPPSLADLARHCMPIYLDFHRERIGL